MKRFSYAKIRNVALLGHGSSGKTSLAEAMLFASGTSQRLGNVTGGNTVSDFDAEEIRRKISIYTTTAPIEWNDCKINILDTPGQPDFEGEMLEGLRAADSAVILVSGKSGIHVGTQKAFLKAKKDKMPAAFFVGKLDDEQADFYKVLEALKAEFGAAVCPIIVPVTEGSDRIYINLIEMKAFKYKDGKATEAAMPDTGHRLKGLVEAISEAIAETSDENFEKFFSGEAFTTEELNKGIYDGIKQGVITPVFCGSALLCEGIDLFLNGITKYFPAPEITDGETSALVFKTVADPYIGKLSYVKVFSGEIRSDTPIMNERTGKPERIGKLYTMCGKKQTETDVITAGDIGAIAKMVSPLTGDTLCSPDAVIKIPGITFPKPCYSMTVESLTKGDEEKIAQGLHRLMDEDPTIKFETDKETKQQILSGLGDLHIDITTGKLKNKFGVGVKLSEPEVAYREAIKKPFTAEGKHKKQTGGHGQYGHVVIKFEPCESEELVFAQAVVGGSVPKNYFPAIEKGLRECVAHGTLAGYPVVNLKATLLDGSYHPVDSSEMAFKLAAALAFKTALPQAKPVLLEPVGSLKVAVPQSSMGDVIGDINKRRGRVLGMDHDDKGDEVIEAEVPVSQMHDFSIVLRSITKNRGSFSFEFVRYEEAPPEVAAAIENAKAGKEAV